MFKRIFLFLVMNLAVIILINIVIAVLENVFGINITGYGFDYTAIFIFALVVGFTGSFVSLFLSKWMAKRAYGVKVYSKEEIAMMGGKERLVYQVVEDISERHRIMMPEVGIYESSEPNAFATGASKNSSLVAVSTGLLDGMSKDEIEGVIGHEMAHILNGDMVTMTLLQGVLNTFVIFLARVVANILDNYLSKGENNGPSWVYYVASIVLEIVFGILASMVAMWFSRHREYRADAGSAEFVGKKKMIDALKALKRMQDITLGDDSKMAAFKISTRREKGTWKELFSSHPSLKDRIQRLEDMSI